ncbi:response regulator receiver protein [Granulicella sibirica]|uniref:Response regulator receiver protein n=2 Tax=Granulicella sibirica TaxID=2479048 RepID=A0A4Q0T6G1_9BACT|nr:response regulator receiver protein [Granulicella sibirica]
MTKTRLLLVDDDDDLRETLCLILEHGGFEVLSAANVNDALKLIGANIFDVLVSDLHMPNDGDGLTVVSAMRHSNPKAVTIIFSAHPEMKAAAAAILAQTDEVFVKPQAVVNLVEMIRAKMKAEPGPVKVVSTVATILEDDAAVTIKNWLLRVDADKHIVWVKLDDTKRTAHLPQLFRDLVYRLRNPLELGSHALVSAAAAEHGLLRREQGYTAAMMVEESRMLQVSIFQTLQNNLHRVNFSLVLIGVMAIADEVDSQLAQAMTAYIGESKVDSLPNIA